MVGKSYFPKGYDEKEIPGILVTLRSGKRIFQPSQNVKEKEKEKKKFNYKPKSESKKENKLKKKEDLIEINEEYKIRKSKRDSHFDKIKAYNIIKDLENTKANIIFGQLIQTLKYEKEVRNSMKRKTYQKIKQVKQLGEIKIDENGNEIINLETKEK